ncbi:MAG: hypothetical protein EOP04_28280 [Proteobacteria bacterium]|nr:MAG: hypothetical protein EOP04_28280 [Pseudomonadota bacterium]
MRILRKISRWSSVAIKVSDRPHCVKLHPYLEELVASGHILRENRVSSIVLKSTETFQALYGKKHKDMIEAFESFMLRHDILNHATRYSERDFGFLNLIDQNCKGIVESGCTIRDLSSEYHVDSKYLEKHSGLMKAALKILKLKEFPGQSIKDRQYLWVLHSPFPKAVLICENLSNLLNPLHATKHNLELWHCGGFNVGKLERAPSREEPMYYLGDWDHHGLLAFQMVRKIYPEITLITPHAIPKKVGCGDHKSLWQPGKVLSGLNPEHFELSQTRMIEKLIERDEWIEEESNNFDRLIEEQIHRPFVLHS